MTWGRVGGRFSVCAAWIAILIQIEKFVRSQPRDQRARLWLDLVRPAGVDPIVDTAAKMPALGGEYPPILVEQDEAHNRDVVRTLL